MPRPLRIEFENAWYHVMNRGANRQAIFKSNAHRNLFYTLLNEIVDRFKIEIHTFCLMRNHYHLLIKTPFPNLNRAMRHLDGIYTQRFNKTVNRDGPLFRGRYKAILIDSDQYLLQVSRYIHLNPVIAKICKTPDDYKWSSYRAYSNEKPSISWLTTSFILNQMANTNKIVSYLAFVGQGVDEETNLFYAKEKLSSIYGKKEFIESKLKHLDKSYIPHVLPDINHTKPLPGKNIILNSVMNYFDITKEQLHEAIQGKKNLAKMISIYLLRQLGHFTHKDISKIFHSLKEKSISTQIDRLNKLMTVNNTIKEQVIAISTQIDRAK